MTNDSKNGAAPTKVVPLKSTSPERVLYENLLNQINDDYSQLKRVFDVYNRELSKRPIGYLRQRRPADFSSIVDAMASGGLKLDPYTINELYGHWGGEIKPFTLDRMERLLQFAHETEVFSVENKPVTHAQWVALDKTERWFTRGSMEAIQNQVLKQQFGTRYATLARAFYHLLRRELGRKPTIDDMADAFNSSSVVEGKQEEVVSALNQLLP